MAERSSCGASTPAREIAASRSASIGVNGSWVRLGLSWSSSQPHSCRAGDRSPATWRSRCRCQVRAAFCSCTGPVGRRSSGLTCVAARHTDTSPTTLLGSTTAALGDPCGRIGVGDGGSDLVGQRADQVGSGGQIVRPTPDGRAALGDAGEPRQRARAGVAEAGVVEPPVEDGGPVVGGVEFAAAGGCRELGDRVGAVRGEQQQMGAQGGPGRLVGQAGHNLLGRDVQRLDELMSCQVFGGHLEGVDVAGGGVAEPDGRVVLLALQGGGGPGRVVAGQDPLEQVGRGGRMDRLGPDEAVRVAVPDDLQVEMVGDPAPGQHGVQLLPGLLAGDQAVHGVGGDPLRGVHGGGVAQLNRLPHVAGGQPDGAAVAVVPHRQVAAAGDLEDGPPVAVLHPVGGASCAGSGCWFG